MVRTQRQPDKPTPWKGPGTRDDPPRGQTNTCENITFPQLRWQAVIKDNVATFGIHMLASKMTSFINKSAD